MSNLTTNDGMITKGNVKPKQWSWFTISGEEVINYLGNNVLGVKTCIGNFVKWQGASPELSYVTMRCVFDLNEISVSAEKKLTTAERMLSEITSIGSLSEKFIKKLEPFRYPITQADWNMVLQDPAKMQKLNDLGLYGDRLQSVKEHSDFTLLKQNGARVAMVFLRPEAIIKDMISNPETNEVDGNFSIVNILGSTSSEFRWEAVVMGGANGGIRNEDSAIINSIFSKAEQVIHTNK